MIQIKKNKKYSKAVKILQINADEPRFVFTNRTDIHKKQVKSVDKKTAYLNP